MSAFVGDNILLSGTMSKKGHLIMNWYVFPYNSSVVGVELLRILTRKQRFIVLTENKIEYFVDSTMKERKGELPVNDETAVEGRVGSIHEFKFTVKTGLRSLTISAPTAEIREEWTQAVRKLVQLKVSGLSVKELSTPNAPVPASKAAGTAQPPLRRRNKQTVGAPTASASTETGRAQRVDSDACESPTPLSPGNSTAGPGLAGEARVTSNRNSANLSKASPVVAPGGATARRPVSTPNGSLSGPPKASSTAPAAEQSATHDDGWEKVWRCVYEPLYD